MDDSHEGHSPVFDAAAVGQLIKAGGVDESIALKLAERFEPIGQRFRLIAMSLPTNLSIGPSDKSSMARQEWLRASILDPTAKLLRGLEDRAQLGGWPDQADLDGNRLDQVVDCLEQLRAFTLELVDQLAARSKDSSTINAELRFDLVSQLADACRETGLMVARGYYAEQGNVSAVALIIKTACEVITGKAFPLDHHLRDYIKINQAKYHSQV